VCPNRCARFDVAVLTAIAALLLTACASGRTDTSTPPYSAPGVVETFAPPVPLRVRSIVGVTDVPRWAYPDGYRPPVPERTCDFFHGWFFTWEEEMEPACQTGLQQGDLFFEVRTNGGDGSFTWTLEDRSGQLDEFMSVDTPMMVTAPRDTRALLLLARFETWPLCTDVESAVLDIVVTAETVSPQGTRKRASMAVGFEGDCHDGRFWFENRTSRFAPGPVFYSCFDDCRVTERRRSG